MRDRRLLRAGLGCKTVPGTCKPGLRPALNLRPEAARLRSSSPADVILDAAQRRVVELPAGKAVLLLGEAGFGKTTVALHRLARLRQLAGPGLRAAVIVPTEGLRRLSAALLERMGVSGVGVWLFDRWAGVEARRAFRKLPERESQDASAGSFASSGIRRCEGCWPSWRREDPRATRDVVICCTCLATAC